MSTLIEMPDNFVFDDVPMNKFITSEAFDGRAEWMVPANVLVPIGDHEIPTLTDEVVL